MKSRPVQSGSSGLNSIGAIAWTPEDAGSMPSALPPRRVAHQSELANLLQPCPNAHAPFASLGAWSARQLGPKTPLPRATCESWSGPSRQSVTRVPLTKLHRECPRSRPASSARCSNSTPWCMVELAPSPLRPCADVPAGVPEQSAPEAFTGPIFVPLRSCAIVKVAALRADHQPFGIPHTTTRLPVLWPKGLCERLVQTRLVAPVGVGFHVAI